MMIASVSTYKNIYFDFYINFPEKWAFRTESRVKESIGMQYQISEDDLPECDGDYKVLFFATFRRENQLIERCNFSVSVHRFKSPFDLLLFAQNKENVMECNYSRTAFLGRDAQEVTISQKYDGKQIITKVIAWKEFPEIWLSAVAEGESLNNFNQAEKLFNRMHRITP